MSQLKGKLGTNGFYTQSVHDDLEQLFHKLRKGIVKEEHIFTFCFPKLDENEMIQIVNKNEDFLKTFYKYYLGENPDVPENQMVLSESKSKFSMVACSRHTFRLGKDETSSFSDLIHHTGENLPYIRNNFTPERLASSPHRYHHEEWYHPVNSEEPEKPCCIFCFC